MPSSGTVNGLMMSDEEEALIYIIRQSDGPHVQSLMWYIRNLYFLLSSHPIVYNNNNLFI